MLDTVVCLPGPLLRITAFICPAAGVLAAERSQGSPSLEIDLGRREPCLIKYIPSSEAVLIHRLLKVRV